MPDRDTPKPEPRERSLVAAYAAWLVGAHYLYLGDRNRFLAYFLSLGGLGFWAVRDFRRMPYLVETRNQGGRLAAPLLSGRDPLRPLRYALRKLRGLPEEPWVALDLETATAAKDSVCGIGYAVLSGGRVTESGQWLVQPPGNAYDPENICIHGITPAATAASPTFAEAWPQLRTLLGQEGRVLMHWSKFDVEVLRACIGAAGLEPVEFSYVDTVGLAKMAFPGLPSHRLPKLARLFGVQLRHHGPESDARALAAVADRCRKAVWATTVSEAATLLRSEPRPFETYATGSPLGGSNLLEAPAALSGERLLGTLSEKTFMPGARVVVDTATQRFSLLPVGGERTAVSREVVEKLVAGGFLVPAGSTQRS